MAIISNMKTILFKILQYPDKCKLDNVNANGETALQLAIDSNMRYISLEILKYPDKCKISKSTLFGRAILISAIQNNMEKVALIIFDNSKIDYSNFIGKDNTILEQVIKRKMEKLALRILKYFIKY